MLNNVEILLVGSHSHLMGSLASQLQRVDCFAVVDVVGVPLKAVGAVTRRRLGIVLFDIDLVAPDCFDAAAAICSIRPDIRSIFISAVIEDHYVEEVLRVRGAGYLPKNDLFETVIPAIHEILAGGVWYTEDVNARLVLDSSGLRLGPLPGARALQAASVR